MSKDLLVDIGGTSYRGLTIDPENPDSFDISRRMSLDCSAFTNPVTMIKYHLDHYFKPERLIIAVAGSADDIKALQWTNLWKGSKHDFTTLGIPEVIALNDMQAQVHSPLNLKASDCYTLAPRLGESLGQPSSVPLFDAVASNTSCTYAFVGQGTGLGVGIARLDKGSVTTFASEGGHILYAPANEEEVALITHLERISGEPTSFESLAGGKFIPNVFNFFAEKAGLNIKVGNSVETVRSLDNEQEEVRAVGKKTMDQFATAIGACAGASATMVKMDTVFCVSTILPALGLSRFNFEACQTAFRRNDLASNNHLNRAQLLFVDIEQPTLTGLVAFAKMQPA